MSVVGGWQIAQAQTIALRLVSATEGSSVVTLDWTITPPQPPETRVEIYGGTIGLTATSCTRASVISALNGNPNFSRSTTAGNAPYELQLLPSTLVPAGVLVEEHLTDLSVCLQLQIENSNPLVLSNLIVLRAADFMPPMPEGGGGDAGDTTAVEKNILPKFLHGIQRGIYDRIRQRQQQDGRWK